MIGSRIYLDNASATPVRKEVLEAMLPYFSSVYGNAGAIHKEGLAASLTIDNARAELAQLLHIRPQGIVFTGSGTESNNLAILGTIEARRKEGMHYGDMEILTTRVEHPSILETCAHAATLGVRVVYADVHEDGLIDLHSIRECISKRTVIVACAYANSEIGVVQMLGKIARTIREAEEMYDTHITFHVDAAQAPLYLPCALDAVGADTLALDAGKCNGPKGIGILAFRHGISFAPITYGGDQEQKLRPGTENTALIVGACASLQIAQLDWEARANAVALLRDAFIEDLLRIDGAVLNGSRDERIANNVNISIPGIDSEFAVVTLDGQGIACSTKSACGGAKGDGSSVVRAITSDEMRARSTIRFTLSEETTKDELQRAAHVLMAHVYATRTAMEKLTAM